MKYSFWKSSFLNCDSAVCEFLCVWQTTWRFSWPWQSGSTLSSMCWMVCGLKETWEYLACPTATHCITETTSVSANAHFTNTDSYHFDFMYNLFAHKVVFFAYFCILSAKEIDQLNKWWELNTTAQMLSQPQPSTLLGKNNCYDNSCRILQGMWGLMRRWPHLQNKYMKHIRWKTVMIHHKVTRTPPLPPLLHPLLLQWFNDLTKNKLHHLLLVTMNQLYIQYVLYWFVIHINRYRHNNTLRKDKKYLREFADLTPRRRLLHNQG